ncbi:creatinase-like [Lytechinus variegatus]|uniref:creatinase-like n=1 Tax=Lytechinus variegatus TaxID=7654 RepID=UPI001BB1AACD|nr:creatinase-like [Lytechinus variegatus]
MFVHVARTVSSMVRAPGRIPPLISPWSLARYHSRIATISSSLDMPKLMTYENGEKGKSIFTRKEMQRRVDALRSHMLDNEIGGVLLTSMHNIKYFSDYLYCSVGRPYGLVITMDKVINIASLVDAGQAWRMSPYSDDVVIYTDWHRDNFWSAVEHLLGNTSGRIGAEFDHIPHAGKLKLGQASSRDDIVDVGIPIMQMRIIKSPEEIAVVKEGARIADLGGEAVASASVEGAAEYEIAQYATTVMMREVAKTFPDSDIRDTWSWVQTGPINSDGAHNATTTRTLINGDIIVLNVFPMIAGYFSALERTLFLNHVPSDRHLEVWQVNCDVHRRGMELVKPGVKCCDIALELNEMYREKNLLQYRSFGYGHSFGVLSHYYGREAALELREDIETVLQPGMVLSMEPHLTIPDGQPGTGGYREHDIMVVTEEGASSITKFPYGPEYNIIHK